MVRDYTPEQFEKLALEASAQFDWSRADGEHHPEGLAFLVGNRIIGGHARNLVRQTAVINALHYLQDQFAMATLDPALRPERILVVTAMRQDGEQPRKPSPSLLRDAAKYLKKAPNQPLHLLVVGEKSGVLTCEI